MNALLNVKCPSNLSYCDFSKDFFFSVSFSVPFIPVPVKKKNKKNYENSVCHMLQFAWLYLEKKKIKANKEK